MTELFKYYSLVSGFPTLLVIIEFFYFLRRDQRLLRWGTVALEIMILVVPLVLLRIFEAECGVRAGTALFSPAYGYFVYALIILCQLAYFYCSYRKRMQSPFPEVLINCLLLTGVIINILIAIRLASWPGIIAICLPAAMLFILMLVNNHRLMIYTLEDVDTDITEPAPRGWPSSTCLFLLQMRPVGKFLLLGTLCIPMLILLTRIMLL